MKLTSESFTHGEFIPIRYAAKGARGKNVSPELSWADAPEGTASFAIICHDPDAPGKHGFLHWLVTDIAPDISSAREGKAPKKSREWVTDAGAPGWYGPNPPHGKAHHYNFTVYALDVPAIELPKGTPHLDVQAEIVKHTLDTAKLTGLYQQ
ncbi:MAG: YbhB/YbcL family Raf kinase inhibitor-like protein [Propionibacteriaceae bacterium]|jgi:Raf kinase inhibitor-like YbhB/YbcL family protein|nr:YbhB/YbcL family Raf kinase inhibitor-like protein [Propionibacteriaceae bacterium]